MSNERNISVFINCPYDDDYKPIFDALLYAVVVCGFTPTSALSVAEPGKPRMERIANSLRESKYSIHDLSRCRGEGDENLARFNMPLELGIAMGQKYYSDGEQGDHDWCLLVIRDSNYKRFLSDLAGYDPKEYTGDVETAVQAIMSWLVVTRDAKPDIPSPRAVLDTMNDYNQAIAELRNDWGEDVPWTLVVGAALKTAQQSGVV